jgi:hypothetical protein
MQYGPRYLGAAVLFIGIILLGILSWVKSRRNGRKGPLLILCGYNMLLLALFIVGLLFDDGFGWAFVPLALCTAPWSFFVSSVLPVSVDKWFGSGLIGNFVLLVIICGGINSFLLYLIVKGVFSISPRRPKIST